MKSSKEIIDKKALAKRRAKSDKEDNFLQKLAIKDIKDRLRIIKRQFKKILIISGHLYHWRNNFHNADVISDDEVLKFSNKNYDLVIHGMSLHYSNDPVGQLIQCKSVMGKDGLFLSNFLGGQTLHELRDSITTSELELTGGISPRVLPMIDIRDAGAFLMRSGFALPVADSTVHKVSYKKPIDLLYDLRRMGETNVQTNRLKKFSHRKLFSLMSDKYFSDQKSNKEEIEATFELITLTGWAPSSDQPKPLRPGSASIRLADVLNVAEEKLKD